MIDIVIRSRFSIYDANQYAYECVGESMTQQHFRDECDINNILARYRTTGFLVDPLAARRPLQYGDYSSVPDYQAAQQVICDAQEAFDSLDSRTRLRFHNNPAELLAFLSDPANRDEAIKLGLIVPAAKPAGTPDADASVVPAPAPDPAGAAV